MNASSSWIARVSSSLVRDESGQDVIEYALAAAFLGIVGVGILQAIGVDVFTAYSNWMNPDQGVPKYWDPKPPGTG
jgi:Flp pilus assembly pilin Flp